MPASHLQLNRAYEPDLSGCRSRHTVLPNALFCSDCDKITSGILMATLRPSTVFVGRGPMKAGKILKSVKSLFARIL